LLDGKRLFFPTFFRKTPKLSVIRTSGTGRIHAPFPLSRHFHPELLHALSKK